MFRRILAAAFAFGLTTGVAQAGPTDLVTASDQQTILNIAKGYGRADLEFWDDGEPKITGRLEGIRYAVYFYDCSDADKTKCKSITFVASWSTKGVTKDYINEWNVSKRFGKAYLDSDGDPGIKLPVNLDFGVTERNLDDTFDWWKVVVTGFRDYLKERS